MLKIRRWHGRLGNNILQVLRCIHFAETFGYTRIELPPHKNFSSTSIVIDLKTEPSHGEVNGLFFDLGEFDVENPSTLVLKEICNRYKHSTFESLFSRDANCNVAEDDHCVTAHVRGGDIFGWRVHPYYLQPPLAYYANVMEKYDCCTLVAQDDKNPVVELLRMRKNLSDISLNEKADFYRLVSSKNLIFSASTFCYAAFLLSDSVSQIYIPKYYYDELPQGPWPDYLSLTKVSLPGYIKNGTWRNTRKQRKLMLEYKIEF